MKKKHFSEEKGNRKDEQILSRYLANLKNIEDQNIKRYSTKKQYNVEWFASDMEFAVL